MSRSFVKTKYREGTSKHIFYVTNMVLAEISAKKPSYSRHARLTVDGALPSDGRALLQAKGLWLEQCGAYIT